MSAAKPLIFVGGAALAALVCGAAKSKSVRNTCVSGVATCMEIGDKFKAETQSILDDANDLCAEARRKNKIDAAVNARLAELEAGIRAEVEEQVDAQPAE